MVPCVVLLEVCMNTMKRKNNMTLTTDATRINELFAEGHRLVFWFDPTADRAEEIDGIAINGKLLKLTGSNYLRAKVLLEHEDRESNYLIYAPFDKLEDDINPLADTLRYGATYASDRISEIIKRMDLPPLTREYLASYPLFWRSSQRMERFIQLELPQAEQQFIDMGVLAVLSGSRVVNFDEICRRVLEDGVQKGKELLQTFFSYGALDAFWLLCKRMYGYHEENPSLEGLVATMLCTYTAVNGVTLPQRLQRYISDKATNTTVFLQQFMGLERTRATYDALSLEYMQRLDLRETLVGKRTEELLNLDAFELVDEVILSRMTRALVEGEPQRPIAGQPMDEVAAHRTQGSLHYAAKYEQAYQMLLHARELMLLAEEQWQFKTAKQMAEAYMQTLYRADTCYRKFCLAFDRLEDKRPYERLSDRVEQVYVNDWLDKLNPLFSNLLNEGRQSLGLPLQEQFASQRISSRAGRERTVVIISDAFRFEVAKELEETLNKRARYEAELSAMTAVLPSVTTLGMAALLPHQQIQVQEGKLGNPLVDGKPSTGTENRQRILQAHYPNAVALTVKEILSMPSSAFSDRFNGKDVIYLYHDQIDAAGDDQTTQNQVFEACERTIVDMETVIRRLTNEISATNYLVTADHGFQYRRSQIQEYEKVETRGTNPIFPGKRFRVTREPENMVGTISFAFPYLEDGGWVSVPLGASIFKHQGGGQNFVHGGASLAEMLVPLMTVKSKKGRQATRKATIKLLSPTQHRLNNLKSVLEFLQEEAISPTVKAASYQVFIEAEDGTVVSAVELVEADSSARTSPERITKTRIMLQSRRYDPGANYYLVVKDRDDPLAQSQRIEFHIDIAFADNFGF